MKEFGPSSHADPDPAGQLDIGGEVHKLDSSKYTPGTKQNSDVMENISLLSTCKTQFVVPILWLVR